MLQLHTLRLYVATAPLSSQLAFLQNSRSYSSRPSGDEEEFKAAREWFQNFTRHSLPEKIAKTSYIRSSGPGGQKTNKTSSKATTTWDMKTLQAHVPKALHPGLRGSNYYVMSSDSIRIDSDIYRNQSENKEETHQRLNEMIRSIYRSIVPGVTSEKQKMKVDGLKKSENSARLKMKKMHGDKKRSRRGGDFD
ncbi:peptidyl-tRNA hydrolase domain-containing protein [Tricladium varicosporioides]|nr:peptidyl-tRNA hydrolase domain-containing protein [Hymenoscyphus varicosporioides]